MQRIVGVQPGNKVSLHSYECALCLSNSCLTEPDDRDESEGVMPYTAQRQVACFMSVAGVIFMSGCNMHADRIRDVEDNPTAYAGKEVDIAGEVTKVYELPLGITDIAAYRVTDGTGQIWVITKAGAPKEGDRLEVKGSVQAAAVIGATPLGTVLQEKDRDLK